MKLFNKIFRVIAALSLVIFAILAYNLADERIISLQGYINFSLALIFFWLSIFLVSFDLTKRDIGYLKIVTVLLVIYSSLSLILYAVRDNTEYQMYSNEEHSVIIMLTDDELRYTISVYNKDGSLFHEKIYQTRLGKHWEIEYSVVGNELIIEYCDAGVCHYDMINLD